MRMYSESSTIISRVTVVSETGVLETSVMGASFFDQMRGMKVAVVSVVAIS